MTTSIINGICRCCSADHPLKDLTSTYNWMGEDEIYMDMLRECFDLSIRVTPNTMGGICEVCITQLRNAYNFKKQVIVTEEMFTKKLEEESYNADIKLENKEDVDLENLEDDPNFSDYDVPIKMEELIIDEDSDEKKTKKRRNAKKCSSAKKIKTESGTSKSARKSGKGKAKESEDQSKVGLQSKKKMITIVPRNESGSKIIVKKVSDANKHQQNIRIVLQSSNATPIRCRGSIGYACAFCSEQYPEPRDLKKHTLEKHDNACKENFMKDKSLIGFVVKLDVTFLRCLICETDIDELDSLMEHLKSVHHKPVTTDIKSHIIPFKFDNEDLRCVVCKNKFNNFKVLLEHMNVHFRNYICEDCGAGFVNKRTLQTHSYRHKKGCFKCDFCEKVFDTRVKKRDHERAVHICLNKRSKCGYCGEKFTDYAKKNDHVVKVHGAKPNVLSCQACDKTFQNQRALTVHTKSYHLMEKRKCYNKPYRIT